MTQREIENRKDYKKVVCIDANKSKKMILNNTYHALFTDRVRWLIYDMEMRRIGYINGLNFDVIKEQEISTPKHYDNSNGSLYDISHKLGLNPWEFDIIKRVVRCRKKGSFVEDLEKTKVLIDIYLKEWKQRDASGVTK